MEWYLPVIWAALIGTAVALYVILDGFDLGTGILFPYASNERERDQMMNSIAPFWDGNETWLVLGGGGLWVAFPQAYAVIMPALYLPVTVPPDGTRVRRSPIVQATRCRQTQPPASPTAARAPRAATQLPRRRQAWLRIFAVRCGLPCDPPIGGHSCNGGMISRFERAVCV